MWITEEKDLKEEGFYFMRSRDKKIITVGQIRFLFEPGAPRIDRFYQCGDYNSRWISKLFEQGYHFKKIEFPEEQVKSS